MNIQRLIGQEHGHLFLNWESRLANLAATVQSIAKTTFKTLSYVSIAYISPNLFAIGFVIGIVFPSEVHTKIKELYARIKEIWDSKNWGVMLILTAVALSNFPIVFASVTILSSAKLGGDMA